MSSKLKFRKTRFFESNNYRSLVYLPFFAVICFFLFFMLPPSPVSHEQNAPPPILPEALSKWRSDVGMHVESLVMLDALKKSIDHYDGRRYAETLTTLAGINDAEKTLIGDYVLLYRARALMALQRHAEARKHFLLLEKYFPDSSQLRAAVIVQCQVLLGLREPEEVRSLLEKYEYTGVEPIYYEARALHLEGKNDQAIALYLQVYAQYPTSSLSPLAQQYLLALSPNALSGTRNYHSRLERAENLINLRNFSAARTILTALGQVAAPDNVTGQRRTLLRAEAEFHLNNTSAAVTVLESFKTDDPIMHARALYLEGASRRRLQQEAAFIALRDRALKLYPESTDTEELAYSVATYFDVNFEHRKAREAYKVLVQAFPGGRHAERAQWKVALAAWFEGNFAESAREFRDYVIANTGPTQAGSGMYWLGRSYAKLGAVEEARYLYRRAQALSGSSYYGLRALEAEEALKDVQTGAENVAPGIDFQEMRAFFDDIKPPVVEAITEPDASGVKILRRAEQLAAAGLESVAIAELRWGSEEHPQNRRALQYIVARISAARGNFFDTISTLRRVFPDYNNLAWDTLPEEAWEMFYPTRFGDIVSKYAKEADMDVPLILSLIRQESAFNPRARSSANARGLMQLLPATALETAPRAKVTRAQAQADNLYDPEINIRLGTTYFAAAMRNRNDRPELALAAYNAGGSRVTRWLREFGDEDMAGFVEQIPFAETRNYVKTVLGHTGNYRKLLEARN